MIILLLGPIKARSFVKDIKVPNFSTGFYSFYECRIWKNLSSAYTPLVIVKGEENFIFNHSDFCYFSSDLLWQQILSLLRNHAPACVAIQHACEHRYSADTFVLLPASPSTQHSDVH